MPDVVGGSGWSAGAEEPAVTAAEHRLLRGVRLHLALWSGGITFVILLLVGVVLYGAVERSLAAEGAGQLAARADLVTRGRPDPGDFGEIGIVFGGPGAGTFVVVTDGSGTPLLAPEFGPRLPEGLPLVSAIQAVSSGGGRDVRSTSIVVAGDRVPVRVLTEGVTFRGQTVYLQVVGDRTTEERTLRVLLLVLVVGGLAALLVASGAGAAYASRALIPIRRSLVAQREALQRQREFAADASHELRTPLTVIRASVEDLERHRTEPVERVGSALADIRDEVDHLTSMVEDLLLLARSDSGAIELERVPVDLGDIASDGASGLAKVAAERGVQVLVDPEPAELLGDPARLRQLVMILVDNAVRHAPPGGHVRVRVRAAAGRATLEVEDDGPGIRPEDLPRVFDRFYRGGDAPGGGSPGGGTGLGLAIAAWVVGRHDGRIEASNVPSGGARFTATLPLSPSLGPGARPAAG